MLSAKNGRKEKGSQWPTQLIRVAQSQLYDDLAITK